MSMSVHILYVGRGDSVIVEFSDGRLAMVDINRAANNTTYPVDYLKENFPGKRLSLFILTHPHPHRLTGLSKLFGEIGFDSFWNIDHNYKPANNLLDNDFKADWDEYLRIRSGGYPEIQVLRPQRGYKFIAGKESLEVLAPTMTLQMKSLQTGNTHLSSYVLRIRCMQNKIILGGSANHEVWEDIYNNYGDDLKASLLLASHHGHADGFFKPAVKAIYPEFVVISSEVESYADAAGYYSRYCTSGIVSTAHLGNIVANCYPSGGVELRTQY